MGWRALLVPLLLLAGCENGEPNPSRPMLPFTFVITSNGVSPQTASIAQGETVTFINNDSLPHQISSDPHPQHSDCPELNGRVLEPTEQFSTVMLSPGRCGFHDDANLANPLVRGSIGTTEPPLPAPQPPASPF